MRIITNEGKSRWLDMDFGSVTAADANYIHDQAVASALWTINHNLGKYPSVTIVTSAGDEVIGDVHYVSLNTIQLSFSASFAGKAFLN